MKKKKKRNNGKGRNGEFINQGKAAACFRGHWKERGAAAELENERSPDKPGWSWVTPLPQNTMKTKITTLFILIMLSSVALAKRGPIPTVEPIESDGVRYVAPNDNGKREYIQAVNIVSGQLLQEITLKRNIIWPWLEGDVQVYFITSMRIEGNMLVITDEKDRIFKYKLLKKPQIK